MHGSRSADTTPGEPGGDVSSDGPFISHFDYPPDALVMPDDDDPGDDPVIPAVVVPMIPNENAPIIADYHYPIIPDAGTPIAPDIIVPVIPDVDDPVITGDYAPCSRPYLGTLLGICIARSSFS